MAVQVPLEHQGTGVTILWAFNLYSAFCSHDYSIYPSSDSTNLRPHSTVLFSAEKNSHRSESLQVKPVLLKGQLYSFLMSMKSIPGIKAYSSMLVVIFGENTVLLRSSSQMWNIKRINFPGSFHTSRGFWYFKELPRWQFPTQMVEGP